MFILLTIDVAQCDNAIDYEMQMFDFLSSFDNSVARRKYLTFEPSQNLMLKLDCFFTILLAGVVAEEALYSRYARLKSFGNDSFLELWRASLQESSCIDSIKAHIDISAKVLLRHFYDSW